MLSGVIITSSGKFLKDKRSYSGNLRRCLEYCDSYSKAECAGVAFEGGDCLAYDSITGAFPNPAGGAAALRQ